ncbi:unnamed protein product [Brachionus calyciflorus]|uniref:Decapping nuclease n=1 Tax=Brachionus calyciflorus TaxID=104777 RepID=A0A813VX71_9BILA|nr:unnamed protein product [Brachionus calyciflorus]
MKRNWDYNYSDRNYANNNSYNRNRNQNRYEETQRKKNYIKLDDHNALINIHPYSIYNRPYPSISQPEELGILLSENRILDIESKKDQKEKYEKFLGIKYLVLPDDCTNLNFDLKIGLEKFVPHIPHQNGIDQLLKWILANKHKISGNDRPIKSDFVCWRGLLTTMSYSPYEKYKDWMFSIILHRGTYYMCEIETDAQKNERLNANEISKSFTYWGHKFETYITSDFPSESPSGTEVVPDQDNNFASVVTNRIGEHLLVYAAEIDCCLNQEHKTLSDYCEIKSSKGESKNDLNYERNIKFLKWWIQSFMIGIKHIKVGLRNDDGIINKIVDCDLDEILVPQRWWKENVCLNLMKEILDSIKKFCTEENHVYLACRDLNSNSIRMRKTIRNSDEFNQHYFLRECDEDNFVNISEKKLIYNLALKSNDPLVSKLNELSIDDDLKRAGQTWNLFRSQKGEINYFHLDIPIRLINLNCQKLNASKICWKRSMTSCTGRAISSGLKSPLTITQGHISNNHKMQPAKLEELESLALIKNQALNSNDNPRAIIRKTEL